MLKVLNGETTILQYAVIFFFLFSNQFVWMNNVGTEVQKKDV